MPTISSFPLSKLPDDLIAHIGDYGGKPARDALRQTSKHMRHVFERYVSSLRYYSDKQWEIINQKGRFPSLVRLSLNSIGSSVLRFIPLQIKDLDIRYMDHLKFNGCYQLLQLKSLNLIGSEVDLTTLPLASRPTLQSLDLRSSTVSNIDLSTFREFTALRSLRIAHTACSKDVIQALVGLALTELDVAHNAAFDNEVATRLATITPLRILSMRRNIYTGVHCDLETIRAFSQNNSITELDLSHHFISVEAAALLSKNTQIKILRLHNCGMTDAAVIALAKSKTIARLELQGNSVGIDGVIALMGLSTLEEVVLHLPFDAQRALPYLASNPRLQYLGLMYSQVGDEGLAALSENRNLKSLLIYADKFSPEGIAQLSNHISIKKLSILNSDIDVMGAMAMVATGINNIEYDLFYHAPETYHEHNALTLTSLPQWRVAREARDYHWLHSLRLDIPVLSPIDMNMLPRRLMNLEISQTGAPLTKAHLAALSKRFSIRLLSIRDTQREEGIFQALARVGPKFKISLNGGRAVASEIEDLLRNDRIKEIALPNCVLGEDAQALVKNQSRGRIVDVVGLHRDDYFYGDSTCYTQTPAHDDDLKRYQAPSTAPLLSEESRIIDFEEQFTY